LNSGLLLSLFQFLRKETKPKLKITGPSQTCVVHQIFLKNRYSKGSIKFKMKKERTHWGASQHTFKKSCSTCTVSLTIQSLIKRALNDEQFVLMAFLDLSAVFETGTAQGSILGPFLYAMYLLCLTQGI
jgi:hypothetical protein